MSNVGTVPPWEFTQEGSFPAPYTILIPASLEVQPYTATATFDGTGSSGAYVPTVTIIGPGGEKLARVQPQTTVAQGASASCTWLPPFGAAASSPSTGTGGIEFGGATPTYGPINTGNNLDVETSGIGGNQNVGIFLNDTDAANGGIIIQSSSAFGINITETAAGVLAHTEGGIFLSTTGDYNSGIFLESSGTGNDGVQIQTNGTSNVGFSVGTNGTSNDGFDFQTTGNGNGGFGVTTLDAGNGGISLAAHSAGGIAFDLVGGGNLTLTGLPTSNPGGANLVWNNGGVLNIT